jgi:hypothetical protein
LCEDLSPGFDAVVGEPAGGEDQPLALDRLIEVTLTTKMKTKLTP